MLKLLTVLFVFALGVYFTIEAPPIGMAMLAFIGYVWWKS